MTKKSVIRLIDSDLHRIIKESVNSILNEKLYGMNRLQGEELYDRIDEYLSKIGDAKVCRFYCTDSIINIAMNQTLGREGKNKIFNIMENLGYKCVNAGGNGEYIMYDFKFDLQENTKKMTNKLNENQSQQRAKRILAKALGELKGVIMNYGDFIRDCFTKQEMDALQETIYDALDKIDKSYDYGPYEGEPYHFGSY